MKTPHKKDVKVSMDKDFSNMKQYVNSASEGDASVMRRDYKTDMRLWFTYFMMCVLFGTVLAGCSSNPTAPSATSLSVNASGTPIVTTTPAGTFSVSGQVTDADGFPVYDTAAQIIVSIAKAGVQLSSQPLFQGTFSFTGLASGQYVLYAADTAVPPIFKPTNAFVLVNDTAPNVVQIKMSKFPTLFTSSIHLTGQFVTPTNQQAIPFGKVTLGGYETITLSDGRFFLYNVTSGSYQLMLSKSGFTDKSIGLELASTGITLGNKTITSVIATTDSMGKPVTAYDLGVIEAVPDILSTGNLIGMVVDKTGAFIPNFNFKLFYRRDTSSLSEITTARASVLASPKGDFNLVNLPAGYYFGVGLSAQIVQTTTANGVEFSIGGTAYTQGLEVQAGKDTIMTIVANDAAKIVAPTLIPLAVNGIPASYTSLDNVAFQWNGVDSVNQYKLKITSSANSPTPYTVTLNEVAVGVLTAVQTARLNINSIPLGIGNYVWQVGSVDETNSSNPKYSDGEAFSIRPSKNDLSPKDGSSFNIFGTIASITLTWPPDPNSSHVVVSLYDAAGNNIPIVGGGVVAGNGGMQSLQIGWSPAPATTYFWRVRYYYRYSTQPIESEMSSFILF
ncbi:MAG: carboxypeptidase regulatory-like domain-containing protein [Candidatus Riflebacteria bacterium]|nr:carboxypeptidase regulatory-like domain-containing protein [Candidatus Riflebacteria bacterium]